MMDRETRVAIVGYGCTIHLFSERPEFLSGGALTQHDIYVPAANTFDLEVAHFLACLRTGREPVTTGSSQRRPLEIVLVAYHSMDTGLPVTLPVRA